ncbi:DNA polymerase III, delta subunit [Dethiosulfatibacter aminovorans DSM 17477]|uniref:DNA polymerase III subunit delta n=1 Tax=Dethiosulfatibacter aminovorans DSM 17477 TaxID=1121476 RepID=A0A1M6DUV2_9FIRM|nr:DNA polymerase III subunit delta [Dethiosulfatibacter aminovorans]SHI77024.1 DNA polymerase III, delta subunit [Dethiosulfatibacter aminovorans DSM 17477]
MSSKDVIILTGNEVYLTDNFIGKLKKKYMSGFEDMNFFVIDNIKNRGDEVGRFMNTIPFMVEKKIMVIENCDFLTSKKSLAADDEKHIMGYLDSRVDENILIFNCSGIKVDSRKKLYKKINKMGSIVKYDKLKENELVSWIKMYVSKNNREMSDGDVHYLAQVIGYLDYESPLTLYDVKNELDKLISNTEKGGDINRSNIDSVTIISIENNIFKLVDFICEGNSDNAFRMVYDMIGKNVAAHYIFHMISRHYRLLLRLYLMEKDGYSSNEIQKAMGLRPFSFNKMKKQQRQLSQNKVKKIYDMCFDFDKRVKKGLLDMETGIDMIITAAKE